ncbi:hypothetical protein ACFV1N_44255 [Streptosporangium canum]|uniref:hypothetical protein n=1 Tax=Streptosporangium canum TaxID=324952 RepID=UPI00367E4B6A
MPAWGEEVPATTASEMSMALRVPKRRWSDLALLTFPAAADELMSWLGDARVFDESFHPSAFASAVRDYDRAAHNSLGTKVKAALDAELTDVQQALTPLRGDWSGDREPAKSALRTLIGKLGDQEVLQASWRDLWTKVGNEKTSAEAIAVPRDLFLALARRAGHNLEWASEFISVMTGVLADDSWAVAAMNTALGRSVVNRVSPEVEPQEWDPLAPAGLTIQERAALCARFLALPAVSSWHAVWLVYEKASMPVMFAALGDISFFSSQYVPDDVQAASAKCSSYARNWTTRDGESLAQIGKALAGMSDQGGVVIVRVLLPARAYADPVSVAQARVDALVAVGKFHTGLGSGDWQLADGHIHLDQARSMSHVFQLDTGAVTESLDHSRQSSVFTEMKAFWEQMDRSASIDDDLLEEAVELLRWWQASQDQSPLARVIADVRVIETASSRIGAVEWHQHLSAFLKPAWIVQSIYDNLRDTIQDALGGEPEGLSQEAYKRRRALVRSARDTSNFPWIGLVPGTTRAALTELLEIYPDHHYVRRRLRALASRLDNRDAFKKWRAQLDTQWIHLIDRLERLRNAITHGGPATADAVQSIAFFSSQLSAWEVQLALESALQGTCLQKAHRDFCKDHSDLLDKMNNAPKPGDVIHDSAVPPRTFP